jgi:hypothetical protein
VSLLVPETKPPARPSLAELATTATPVSPAEEAVNLKSRILYLRSYLLMRTIIGFMGITLPILLILGDNLLSDGSGVAVRGSLSGYYYSGVRDFFVGSLVAIGVFLITYKLFERSLNNLLSVVGGLAAMVVAFFPTSRPDGGPDAMQVPLTPIQVRLGEATVAHVHYTAAGIFIVSLAIITFFFGLQEGRRGTQRVGRQSMLPPSFWRWFHWASALVILAAVGFMVLSRTQHMFTAYSLLIGQIVAIVAFGLSWLAKGLELDVLLGPRSARRRWRREREVAAQNP